MKSIVAYIRNLLSFGEEKGPIRTSFKRDREDDDYSSDENLTPVHKKLRQLKKTSFPDMSSHDLWDNDSRASSSKSVRYVPIQVEGDRPSTSTPIEAKSRVRTVPIKLVGVTENGPSTPSRKPRMHTPVKPIIHAVVVDDDDDNDEEPEVTWVETRQDNSSKNPRQVYIDLDDDENDHKDDEVIYLKKVTTPPPTKPYKYFATKNNQDVTDLTEEEPVYVKLNRRSTDKNILSMSPRTLSKFKSPPGITKTYKKAPTPLPKWWMPPSHLTTNQSSVNRNRFFGLNGNARSTLAGVFNLDEKRSYQELIKRVINRSKPVQSRKPVDIINLAEDAGSLRLTTQQQKIASNEIKLVERGLIAQKENDFSKEYDPVTVASLNSSDSELEIVRSGSSTSSGRIDSVNTLKDAHKNRMITSSEWLTKLDSKYRQKKLEAQEKLNDVKRETDIISKVITEQKIAHLENKLKNELSIPESLYEDIQPTVELPPLSPEQEKLVNRALGPGPNGQLLVEKFNLRIHRRDLQTLSGLNWLNDEVINFYMNLLMQRSEERKDLPKVYATNTFFYPKLMQSGQAGLKRWTRKVDIFAHDLMVVPVHLGVHWCLSIIDFRAKKVSYLDSMGGRNQACLKALMQYLKDEHQDKKGAPFDDSGWKTECLKDIPQQMNGSDCGMFACTFAEFSSRDAPYTFSQAHMPYLRRKAALEILRGKLLL